MRIAHITASANSPGGEAAAALCRMASYAGHKALLCYSDGTPPKDIFSCQAGSKPTTYQRKLPGRMADSAYRRLSRARHLIGSRLTDRSGFFSEGMTRRLIRQLDLYQPDLVHLYTLHGYCYHLPTLLKWLKSKNIPVVWTLEDCWPFTGHCQYYTDAFEAPPPEGAPRKRQERGRLGCERWKSGCGSCVLKQEYPKSLFLDRSHQNWCEKRALITALDYLVLTVPSQWLLGEVRQSFLGSFPVYVIPDALQPEEYLPCDDERYMRDVAEYYGLSRLNGRKMLLAAAEVWDERSGLEDLILLSEDLPPEYCLVLVGLDEYQLSSLQGKNLLGLRPLSGRKDLCALMSAADVFVSAVHADASCISVLKALACGTQVLCYATAAFPEVITEEVGHTVPLGEYHTMARCVMEMCASPRDPAACMNRAREYTAANREAAYMRLYENMYRHSPDYQNALNRPRPKEEDA